MSIEPSRGARSGGVTRISGVSYRVIGVLPDRVPMTVDTVFDLASLTKPMATAVANQQQGKWVHTVAQPLNGKTLGILGLGAIGQEVARQLGLRFRINDQLGQFSGAARLLQEGIQLDRQGGGYRRRGRGQIVLGLRVHRLGVQLPARGFNV